MVIIILTQWLRNNMTYLKNILPDFVIEKAVEHALQEDLGHTGDITTNSLVLNDKVTSGLIKSRQDGVVAGLAFAQKAFFTLSPDIKFEILHDDGQSVAAGDVIAEITGPSRALLTGERVALNFLGYLSGIATHTHMFVEQVSGTDAKICCTRKTTPGLRAFEKYAVRAGGGYNHRFGLFDAVMIKDNHIVIAGGITNAVSQVKKQIGHNVKIEVEVDTLEQLEEVLTCHIDIVLLDNMSPGMLKEAVEIIGGRLVTEASGGVTLANVGDIAKTGVNLISVGALTHSSSTLDIGLDF